MTGSSASQSSASDSRRERTFSSDGGNIQLWLAHRQTAIDSAQFKRRVLSHYLDVPAQEIRFATGDNGKPELAHPAAGCAFNLSHTGDWLVCAITGSGSVGVDLEVVSNQRRILALARRFFGAVEVAALESLQASEKVDYFHDLWTLKEAAVKARGEALPPKLEKRTFQVSYDKVAAGPGIITPVAEVNALAAHYFLVDPLPQLRLAVCCLSPDAGPPALKIFLEDETGRRSALSPTLRALSVPGAGT